MWKHEKKYNDGVGKNPNFKKYSQRDVRGCSLSLHLMHRFCAKNTNKAPGDEPQNITLHGIKDCTEPK